MTALVKLQPEHVIPAWPYLDALLRRIVERSDGEVDFDGTAQNLVSGKAQAWLAWDGEAREVLALAIGEWRTPKRYRVWACTGRDRAAWQHFLDKIESWAQANGAEKIELLARRGWARVVKGYRTGHVQLVKRLGTP